MHVNYLGILLKFRFPVRRSGVGPEKLHLWQAFRDAKTTSSWITLWCARAQLFKGGRSELLRRHCQLLKMESDLFLVYSRLQSQDRRAPAMVYTLGSTVWWRKGIRISAVVTGEKKAGTLERKFLGWASVRTFPKVVTQSSSSWVSLIDSEKV